MSFTIELSTHRGIVEPAEAVPTRGGTVITARRLLEIVDQTIAAKAAGQDVDVPRIVGQTNRRFLAMPVRRASDGPPVKIVLSALGGILPDKPPEAAAAGGLPAGPPMGAPPAPQPKPAPAGTTPANESSQVAFLAYLDELADAKNLPEGTPQREDAEKRADKLWTMIRSGGGDEDEGPEQPGDGELKKALSRLPEGVLSFTFMAAGDDGQATQATNGNWTAFRGKRGGVGWQNTQTGRIVYTKSPNPPGHARRQRQASAASAMKISGRVLAHYNAPGEEHAPSEEELHELATHLPALNVDQLRNVRNRLLASWGDAPRKEAMVHALRKHVADLVGTSQANAGRMFPHYPGRDAQAEIDARAAAEKRAARPKRADGGGSVARVPLGQLHVDPERFQFKMNVDKQGVTNELKGVKKFNPELAGVVATWQDPETGKEMVVNGHHRYELAGRTGQTHLDVRRLSARNATEARAKGALINIAEGRGTAMDAAKFMRDMNLSPTDLEAQGVSLKGAVARDAQHLRNLADPLFHAVARGQMEEARAVQIGQHLAGHPDLQVKLANYIQKREDATGRDWTPKQVAEAAREMAAAPIHEKDAGGLFGGTEEDSRLEERADLKAHLRAALATQKRDFEAVGSERRAGNVAGAGNVLNVEENKKLAKQHAQAAELFDRTVNLRGPVADLINETAEKYADAPKQQRNALKADLTERVRQLLAGGPQAVGAPGEPAEPEPAGGAPDGRAGVAGARDAGVGGPGAPPAERGESAGAGTESGGQPGAAGDGGGGVTPIRAYHGTGTAFDRFEDAKQGSSIDAGFLGRGHYFTSKPETAHYYANVSARGTGQEPVVHATDLHLKNPYPWGPKGRGVRGEVYGHPSIPEDIREAVYKRAGFEPATPEEEPDFSREPKLAEALRAELEARGHDGVTADLPDGEKEHVVFRGANAKIAETTPAPREVRHEAGKEARPPETPAAEAPAGPETPPPAEPPAKPAPVAEPAAPEVHPDLAATTAYDFAPSEEVRAHLAEVYRKNAHRPAKELRFEADKIGGRASGMKKNGKGETPEHKKLASEAALLWELFHDKQRAEAEATPTPAPAAKPAEAPASPAPEPEPAAAAPPPEPPAQPAAAAPPDPEKGPHEMTRQEYAEHLQREGYERPKNADVHRQRHDEAILSELFRDEIEADPFAKGMRGSIKSLREGILRNVGRNKLRDPAAFNLSDRVIRDLYKRAIAAGKPVPAEVLKDYPDLAPAAKPTAPVAAKTPEQLGYTPVPADVSDEEYERMAAAADAKAKAGLAKAAAGEEKKPPAAEPEPPPADDRPVHQAGAVRYRPTRRAHDAGDEMVEVDPKKMDAAWQKDAGYHIPAGGGADPTKYRQAGDFLADPANTVDAPEATYENGTLSFKDGRHRAAQARDKGHKSLFVSLPKEHAAAARRDLAPGPAEPPKAPKPPAAAPEAPPKVPADYDHPNAAEAYAHQLHAHYVGQMADRQDGSDHLGHYLKAREAIRNLPPHVRDKVFARANELSGIDHLNDPDRPVGTPGGGLHKVRFPRQPVPAVTERMRKAGFHYDADRREWYGTDEAMKALGKAPDGAGHVELAKDQSPFLQGLHAKATAARSRVAPPPAAAAPAPEKPPAKAPETPAAPQPAAAAEPAGDIWQSAREVATGGTITPEQLTAARDAYMRMSQGDKLQFGKALGHLNLEKALPATRDELVMRSLREGEFRGRQAAKGLKDVPDLHEGALFGAKGVGESGGLFDDADAMAQAAEEEGGTFEEGNVRDLIRDARTKYADAPPEELRKMIRHDTRFLDRMSGADLKVPAHEARVPFPPNADPERVRKGIRDVIEAAVQPHGPPPGPDAHVERTRELMRAHDALPPASNEDLAAMRQPESYARHGAEVDRHLAELEKRHKADVLAHAVAAGIEGVHAHHTKEHALGRIRGRLTAKARALDRNAV